MPHYQKWTQDEALEFWGVKEAEKQAMDKKHISKHITHYCYMDSPLGLLMLAGCKRGLRLVNFPKGSQARKPLPHWQSNQKMFTQARSQLDAYFGGDLQKFTIPLLLEGTPFQKQVWQALQNIPYGELASYGGIAKVLENSGAARAVGGANNANPIPIIVPCHRVIGADKSLIGFGGGLPTKKFLLDLEAKHAVIDGRLI